MRGSRPHVRLVLGAPFDAVGRRPGISGRSKTLPAEPLNVRVFVFDLDGTLLQGSSMRIWIRHLLRRRARSAGFTKQAAALMWRVLVATVAALRAARIISNRTTKRTMQGLGERLDRCTSADEVLAQEQALARELMRHIRPNLARLVAMIRESGDPMLLSTATVAECAEPIARALGIDHVSATPYRNAGPWVHNIGDRKARNAVDAARALAPGAPLVVFVDQLDDLPLIDRARAVCWFGRDSDLPRLAGFLRSGVPVTRARRMSADALAAELGLTPWVPADDAVFAVGTPRDAGLSDRSSNPDSGGATVLRPQGE